MINTSHPQELPTKLFSEYLINDIGLSKDALELGIKHSINENAPLAIVLWQLGLVNLDQYQKILDWKYSTKFD